MTRKKKRFDKTRSLESKLATIAKRKARRNKAAGSYGEWI